MTHGRVGLVTIFMRLARSGFRISVSYGSKTQSTAVLVVNISSLAVPSVAAAGPVQIIYCSVVWMAASIVFSLGLLNVYSNTGLLVARNAVCLSTGLLARDFRCSRWRMTMTVGRSVKRAMSCNYAVSPSPPFVRRRDSSHSPFAHMVSRIALFEFSAAPTVHVFGPKELALSRPSTMHVPSSWRLRSWA